MVLSIQPPGFLCCKYPGLVLGYLATSSALVLVVIALLTLGNSLFVRREQHWEVGCLEPHPQSTTLSPPPEE